MGNVDPDTFARWFDAIVSNIGGVVRGKREAIELAVIALLAEGHLLIEDVPGVGKTSLAKALATSIECSWNRIQFTPDLLPSDLVGVNIYERSNERFRFVPGPMFANIVLADEINRASPKTQSALLESMEERQVTVDGTTMSLPTPFMVIATQNPIEHEGTHRLPESQLDRFALRIAIGYPDRQAEHAMLDGHGAQSVLDELVGVISLDDLTSMIAMVRSVFLARPLKDYLIDLTTASRNHPGVELGLSPRATLQLAALVRAVAATSGRDYATPDDVHRVADAALAHRLVLAHDRGSAVASSEIIADLVGSVPIPTRR